MENGDRDGRMDTTLTIHWITVLLHTLACHSKEVRHIGCAPKCTCEAIEDNKGTFMMECRRLNTVKGIPTLIRHRDMEKITEIRIENQKDFTHLTNKSLQYFTNLEELTIEDTALSWISPDALAVNSKLRIIKLRRNKLKVIPWRILHGLGHTLQLLVNDNPLACNCSHKWIQKIQNLVLFGSRASNITCEKELRTGEIKVIRLADAVFSNCQIPKAIVNKNNITVNESGSFTISCREHGVPKPTVRWVTDNLVSNFTIEPRADGQDLIVYNVSAADIGFLKCDAESVAGMSYQELRLYVNSSPKIRSLTGPEEKFHWCIRYVITGYPAPNITWYKDGVRLYNSPSISNEVSFDTGFSNTTGCLMFKFLNAQNNGIYRLEAKNDYGVDSKTIKANFRVASGIPSSHVFPPDRPKPPSSNKFSGRVETTDKKDQRLPTQQVKHTTSYVVCTVFVSFIHY